jgi:hypothetical protein
VIPSFVHHSVSLLHDFFMTCQSVHSVSSAVTAVATVANTEMVKPLLAAVDTAAHTIGAAHAHGAGLHSTVTSAAGSGAPQGHGGVTPPQAAGAGRASSQVLPTVPSKAPVPGHPGALPGTGHTQAVGTHAAPVSHQHGAAGTGHRAGVASPTSGTAAHGLPTSHPVAGATGGQGVPGPSGPSPIHQAQAAGVRVWNATQGSYTPPTAHMSHAVSGTAGRTYGADYVSRDGTHVTSHVSTLGYGASVTGHGTVDPRTGVVDASLGVRGHVTVVDAHVTALKHVGHGPTSTVVTARGHGMVGLQGDAHATARVDPAHHSLDGRLGARGYAGAEADGSVSASNQFFSADAFGSAHAGAGAEYTEVIAVHGKDVTLGGAAGLAVGVGAGGGGDFTLHVGAIQHALGEAVLGHRGAEHLSHLSDQVRMVMMGAQMGCTVLRAQPEPARWGVLCYVYSLSLPDGPSEGVHSVQPEPARWAFRRGALCTA